MIKTFVGTVAAVLLTIIPAIMHGNYQNRWNKPYDLLLAAGRLPLFPREMGPWHFDSDEKALSESACRELGLSGHFSRNYVHSDLDERINILLMIGQPGQLVRHPPSVCYANRAFQQIGEETTLEIVGKAANHSFKVLQYRRAALPSHQPFYVAYAHSSDGTWKTPASPRIEFGGESKLYKVQILFEVSSKESLGELKGFLKEFVQDFPVVLPDTSPAEPVTSPAERD